ncbi:MAG: SAM-dependent methyltransferase [Kofleriaceae bacterium]
MTQEPAARFDEQSTPSRIVHHADGLAFLATPLPATSAIITSLPDVSELPDLGRTGSVARPPGDAAPHGAGGSGARSVDAWRTWFIDTVALACRAVADDAVAIFYQTDIKHDGRWVDKGHLVQLGAAAAGSFALWHKIVCRVPPGLTTFGRPAYAHCICVSRTRRLETGASTPDVLPALGTMSWSRAMGAAACEMAVKFVASIGATTVIDPFCGVGSALAAANAFGLDAIGVEISRRRSSRARRLIHHP